MKLKERLTNQQQMSEAFILNAFLAVSGGFQDAYTDVVRGKVFANAQTGTVVLMSINFLNGNWVNGLRYLLPLIAFSLGIFAADCFQSHFKYAKRFHWRQGILIIEMLVMLAVGFLPNTLNMIANVLVSFSCAMQVQSFRTVGGNSYASTMCIGNLRSGVAALSSYLRTNHQEDKVIARYYFRVILLFAVGAGIGGILSDKIGCKTIWLTIVLLLIGLLLMELDRKREDIINT